MAAERDQLHELAPPTPAPLELRERAAALVRNHAECFWFRRPEARIRHLEDVRLVVGTCANTATAAPGGMPRNYTDASHSFTKAVLDGDWEKGLYLDHIGWEFIWVGGRAIAGRCRSWLEVYRRRQGESDIKLSLLQIIEGKIMRCLATRSPQLFASSM
jgi:hypothetical protein